MKNMLLVCMAMGAGLAVCGTLTAQEDPRPRMSSLSTSPAMHGASQDEREPGRLPPLAKLPCVRLLIDNHGPVDGKLSIAEDELRTFLREAIGRGLPGLRVDERCSSLLHADLNLVESRFHPEEKAGYSALLSLDLRRKVSIEETGAMILAPVWIQSGLFSGSAGSARADVRRTLESLVADFGAAYKEAGNG